jgi:hypothetical protein
MRGVRLRLRKLLRAVEWTIREADTTRDGTRSKALRNATRKFEHAVPNADEYRDVVNSLDGYVRQTSQRHHTGVRSVILLLVRGAQSDGPMNKTLVASSASGHVARSRSSAGSIKGWAMKSKSSRRQSAAKFANLSSPA